MRKQCVPGRIFRPGYEANAAAAIVDSAPCPHDVMYHAPLNHTFASVQHSGQALSNSYVPPRQCFTELCIMHD